MKFKLDLDKRAYVQVDFAFAAFIFFIFFLSILSFYTNQKNSLDDTINLERLQSDARDLCYILISSEGRPINWQEDLDNLDFVGLKNTQNSTLNISKMNTFSDENYFTIIDSLDLSEFIFIQVEGILSQTIHLEFGVSGSSDSLSSSYTCYSNYDGEVVKVLVEIWN